MSVDIIILKRKNEKKQLKWYVVTIKETVDVWNSSLQGVVMTSLKSDL